MVLVELILLKTDMLELNQEAFMKRQAVLFY